MGRLCWCMVLAVGLTLGTLVACGDDDGGGGGGTGGSAAGTGGSGGTGGGGGVAGSGGAGGNAGDASLQCPESSILTPGPFTVITAAEDLDQDCTNGITIEVNLTTNAPEGTIAKILLDGTETGSATATGGYLKFVNVKFKSAGVTELTVRFGTDTSCDLTTSVTTACP